MTGRIAAGHPAVVDAAAGILPAGGNAFDAAVAAGFAAAVAEPGLTSLAGGGFLLARTAAGEEVLFDFFVDTPGRGLPVDRPSPASRRSTSASRPPSRRSTAASARWRCPARCSGYLHVHDRLGRLPLDAVVAAGRPDSPADGVALAPRQAAIVGILEPILTREPATRRGVRTGRAPAPRRRAGAQPRPGRPSSRAGRRHERRLRSGPLHERLVDVDGRRGPGDRRGPRRVPGRRAGAARGRATAAGGSSPTRHRPSAGG